MAHKFYQNLINMGMHFSLYMGYISGIITEVHLLQLSLVYQISNYFMAQNLFPTHL